jgi:serine/threonine protein kinase
LRQFFTAHGAAELSTDHTATCASALARRQDERVSDPSVLSSVAGYRVVRRLGAGARSVVYLGHAGSGADSGAGPVGVAIKVFEAGVHTSVEPEPSMEPDRSIEQTVRALSTLTETHPGRMPALLDLATLPDGRVVLVLERVGGASLSDLLRARQKIDPGEAVTILAPVVAALGAVHESGFWHTTLCQSSVLFDESGRPVLCGLGGLRELPPFGTASTVAISEQPRSAGQPPARFDCVREDYTRLTVLLRSVFDHLEPDSPVTRRAEPIAAWFELATATIPFEPCLGELERRLFEWAPACPVRDGRQAWPERRLTPARLDPRGEAAATPAGDKPHRSPTSRPGAGSHHRSHDRPRRRRRVEGRGWFDAFHLPAEIAVVAAAVLEGNPLAALGKRMRDRALTRMRGKRRPIIAAACLGAAVVVLALTLIPPKHPPSGSSVAFRTAGGGVETGGGAGAGPTQRTGPQRTGPQSAAPPSAGPGAAGKGLPGAGAPSGQPSDSPGGTTRIPGADRAAIAGDDPLLAAAALMRVRALCLAAASVICLDAADQAGSVAMATDGYAVRMVQQGTPAIAGMTWESHTASLAERSGDSALVTLTPGHNDPERKPASLLVVKGEAGWRLREIFEQ